MPGSTIPSLSGPFLADGNTVAFPFAFTASSAADVQVDIDGVVVNNGFSVGLNANGGGVVTFNTPPQTGTIYIYYDPTVTQPATFEQGSAYTAAAVNAAAAVTTAQLVTLKRDISRALKLPVGSTAAPLPVAAKRAGMYLAFDATGKPGVASGTGNDAALRTDLASAANGAGLVGFDPTAGYSNGTLGGHTAQNPLPQDAPWLCDATGTVDCTTALQAYFTWCAANNRPARLRGTYKVSSTIVSNVRQIDGGADYDGHSVGTTIVFSPAAGYADLLPAVQIAGGMYAGGLVRGLRINGPEAYTMANAPVWCPNPAALPSIAAFAAGTAGFQIIGSNQPVFEFCSTRGVKIGRLDDSQNGHIHSYECGWYGWLAGVYCRVNSEDYRYIGGSINGLFTGYLFGTTPWANHFGGVYVYITGTHMGFSAYAFYQVTEPQNLTITTTAGSATASYSNASGLALAAPMAIASTALPVGTTVIGANSAALNLSAAATQTGSFAATATVQATTPTLGVYGVFDGQFEQIGEAVIATLDQSTQQSLEVRNWNFSWSQLYTGWASGNPSGWASNLHPSILPYGSQQQYALRLGKMVNTNLFRRGNGFGYLSRSPNATSPLAIARVAQWSGSLINAGSDFSGLLGDVQIVAFDNGTRRTGSRGGGNAVRGDLCLPSDWRSGNLLNSPETASNWTSYGATPITITDVATVGGNAPQQMFDELGNNPAVIHLSGTPNGGGSLAQRGSSWLAAQPNRRIGYSFWLYSPAARVRIATGTSGTVYYDNTITSAGGGWQRFEFVGTPFADPFAGVQAFCGAAVGTTSLTMTSGQTTVNFANGTLTAGQSISGSGIPAGTTVTSVNSAAATAVLSNAPTATATITASVTTWADVWLAGLMVFLDDVKPYNASPNPRLDPFQTLVGLPTTTAQIATTVGSQTITITSGTLSVGYTISVAGIPAGASVTSVNASAGTAVVSLAATATTPAGTSVTATLSPVGASGAVGYAVVNIAGTDRRIAFW